MPPERYLGLTIRFVAIFKASLTASTSVPGILWHSSMSAFANPIFMLM